MIARSAFALLALLPLGAFAQLTQLWSVDQGDSEYGWCQYDINGDGLLELIKEDGLGTTFLDGADFYSVLWTVVDPDPDANAWFSLAAFSGDDLVFTRVNTTSQQSEVLVWPALASNPSWTSGTLNGVLYRVDADPLYSSGIVQLSAAWNRLQGSSYFSNWRVWNLGSGAVSHNPAEAAGYLAGPWTGPVETSLPSQLYLNRYANDGSVTLECWGSATAVGENGVRPTTPGLAAWPNPFNPACRISLEHSPAGPFDLRITDLRGALVRRFELSGNGGPLQLVWDGRNQQGRPVASGSYRVEAGGEHLGVTLLR
jgi:hypothetical protein